MIDESDDSDIDISSKNNFKEQKPEYNIDKGLDITVSWFKKLLE